VVKPSVSPDPRPLIGEPLPLDLLNTRWNDREGGAHDLLESLDGLATWLTSAGFADHVPADSATLHALLVTRDALRSVVSGETAAAATLNETLAHGCIRRALKSGGPRRTIDIGSSSWLPAWAAAEGYLQLLEETPDRIASCANPGCVLYFYDRSHNRTRRWCSVTGCGSRALRRLAAVVADGASPRETFDAVAMELGRFFETDHVTIQRYEPDESATLVGRWTRRGTPPLTPPSDGQWPITDDTVAATVLRTGKPARIMPAGDLTTRIEAWLWSSGVGHVVGCPVFIEGRPWGVISVLRREGEPLPESAEAHLVQFTVDVGLVLTESERRTELLASQKRVVAAGDEARRRLERDLHDSVQQHLISVGLEVVKAKDIVPAEQKALRNQLSFIADCLNGVQEELREISRGLYPFSLSQDGLVPALRNLARLSRVPVEVEVGVYREVPRHLQVAIYHIASEAVANAAKHAHASSVAVSLDIRDGLVQLSVIDDGVGGAKPGRGSGLVGLRDRVASLGGKIRVTSPPGEGTSLEVELPVED
jgi:signal transduction histidine kinase/predicted RNA-binding Zn ribbon-like protein